MPLTEGWVEVPTADGAMECFLAHPATGGPFPPVRWPRWRFDSKRRPTVLCGHLNKPWSLPSEDLPKCVRV